MVNLYQKGVRKERKIKKMYERQGYVVLRSAGSHGFADLIAINKEERKIIFIQCKPDGFNDKKLKEAYKWIFGDFKTEFIVV